MTNSSLSESASVLHEESINATWLILVASLVFMMQIGFMALEVGSVGRIWRPGTVVKNFEDLFLGIVSFSVLGYSIAFSHNPLDSIDGVIGGTTYAFLNNIDPSQWLFVCFQLCFVSTAATIVSGCVVERMTSGSYAVFSFLLSFIVYPVLVHWVWCDFGWLYKLGFLDFAGSGVVHMTGGLAGLVLLYFLPKRFGKGCGIKGLDHDHPDLFMIGTGVFLLWLGWIGFNCGSVIYMVNNGTPGTVGLIAINVLLSACVAASTSNMYLRFFKPDNNFDLTESLNCLLAGLVAITAGCDRMQPWAAAVIGVQATFFYFVYEHYVLKRFNIDDPLSVTSVHLMAGCLGVINVGLFSSTGNSDIDGLFICGNARQLGIQLLGLVCMMAWVFVSVAIIAKLLESTMGIKASLFVEDQGVRLWEFAPDLAFKLLFKSHKEDVAASLWLWSFHEFVQQVYPHLSKDLDKIVAIDTFKEECNKVLQELTTKEALTNGRADMGLFQAKVLPWIRNLRNSHCKGHDQDGFEDQMLEELGVQDIDISESTAASPSRPASQFSRQKTGIESVMASLQDYVRENSVVNKHIDFAKMVELRFFTIFDSFREDSMKQLESAWDVFARQGIPDEIINWKIKTVYDIESETFTLCWQTKSGLERQGRRQKSIYSAVTQVLSPRYEDVDEKADEERHLD